jgi:hypothetical protein
LISLYHPDPMRWLAVLGVYLSAVAVLAWRRRDSSHGWTDPFVLSTMAVICLDCLMVVAHLLRLAALWKGPQSGMAAFLIIVGAALILLFTVLSGIGLRSSRHACDCRFNQ